MLVDRFRWISTFQLNFTVMHTVLGPDILLHLFSHMLFERRILFVSSKLFHLSGSFLFSWLSSTSFFSFLSSVCVRLSPVDLPDALVRIFTSSKMKPIVFFSKAKHLSAYFTFVDDLDNAMHGSVHHRHPFQSLCHIRSSGIRWCSDRQYRWSSSRISTWRFEFLSQILVAKFEERNSKTTCTRRWSSGQSLSSSHDIRDW